MAGKNYGHEAWIRAKNIAEGLDFREDIDLITGGSWTEDKLYFLCQYLAVTCHGMRHNEAFPGGLCFIDLFAGSGLCSYNAENARTTRLPGSSLIAASIQPKSFTKIIACDERPDKLEVLTGRLRIAGFQGAIDTVPGDVNNAPELIASKIPNRSLSITFVDPFSLDIHYNTIQSLSKDRSMDLVILFTDRTDLIRNLQINYLEKRGEKGDKLDLFLGDDSDWRNRYKSAKYPSGYDCLHLFAAIYRDQLKRIGYAHTDIYGIPPTSPLFTLVYASKHLLGLKYFGIARSSDSTGQRSLFRP